MEEKVVIVTGGSRGIGAETVKYLAKNNYKVILNYNKSEECAIKIKNELKSENKYIDIFKADITKRNEIKALIEFTINKYGKIDVLINNAGISQIKMFTDITEEDWECMIQTNLTSAFNTSQEALKYMIPRKSGLIINISSIWGKTGASCEVHYSAAKARLRWIYKGTSKRDGII